MKRQTDSKGNDYFEIENIRVTHVKHKNRLQKKDWPGCDTIRIQAKRNTTNNALHQGAEFPVSMKDNIIELVKVLLEVHKLQ